MGIRDLLKSSAGASIVKGKGIVAPKEKEETIFSQSYIARKAAEAAAEQEKKELAKQAKIDEREARRETIAKLSGLPVSEVKLTKGRAPKPDSEKDPSKVPVRRSPITVKVYRNHTCTKYPEEHTYDNMTSAEEFAKCEVSCVEWEVITKDDQGLDLDPKDYYKKFKGYKTPNASVVDLTWRESEPIFSLDNKGKPTVFNGEYRGNFAKASTYSAEEFRRQWQDKLNRNERFFDAHRHNLVEVINDPKHEVVSKVVPAKPAVSVEIDGVKVELGEVEATTVQSSVYEDNLKAKPVRLLNKERGKEITRNTSTPSVAHWQQRARSDKATFSRG